MSPYSRDDKTEDEASNQVCLEQKSLNKYIS